MLILNKNQKRQPIGGHQFTSYAVTFTGDTFDEVVEKLKDFRRNNNIPIGNPEGDILLYYAKNWPYMVTSVPDVNTPENDLYTRWRDWVYRTWRTPPKKFITTKEATDRWVICEKCPFNRKQEWDKTEESTEVARRAYVLRKGLQTPPFLGYCALHRADLPTLVFVDEPAPFSAKKEGEQMEGCWVIR